MENKSLSDFFKLLSEAKIESQSKVEIIQEEKDLSSELIERTLGLYGGDPEENLDDPLTPINQKFVSIDDFNKHYNTLVERIQHQLSTIGGGGETRLLKLDDVNSSGASEGRVLVYRSGNRTLEFADINIDSSFVTSIVDEQYIRARQVDIYRDSSFITDIIDEDYIQARQLNDSNFVTSIVDEDYIQARQLNDSSFVTNIIDEDYIQARQVDIYRDSSFVVNIVDSSYVQNRVTFPQSDWNVTDSSSSSFIQNKPPVTYNSDSDIVTIESTSVVTNTIAGNTDLNLVGANTEGNGGAVSIAGGIGASGTGGNTTMAGGIGQAGRGGNTTVVGGIGIGGEGGSASLLGGNNSDVSSDGGSVNVIAGSGVSGGSLLISGGVGLTSFGGEVTVQGGAGPTGAGGDLRLWGGIGGGTTIIAGGNGGGDVTIDGGAGTIDSHGSVIIGSGQFTNSVIVEKVTIAGNGFVNLNNDALEDGFYSGITTDKSIFTLAGADYLSGGNDGGNITIKGGLARNGGDNGDIIISSGTGGSDSTGYISLLSNFISASGAWTGTVDFTNATVNGDITGNAATATALETSRNFSISGGGITAEEVSFDGTGNVVLNASIDSNAVILGDNTTGNYVADISGTAGQIEVTGSGSETATVIVSLPNELTIPLNLTVPGNLTVQGTTTSVDTTNTEVKDNVIILNSGESGSGVTLSTSGIEVDRGTDNNTRFIWNESTQGWQAQIFDGVNWNSTTLFGPFNGDLTGDVTGTVSDISNHSTTNLAEGDNLYYTKSRVDSDVNQGFTDRTTDDLTEGDNLYYTKVRVDSDVNQGFTDRTTTDLTEGDNLYYTQNRFDSAFSNKVTTDLTEGDNLYYTKVRVDSDVNQGFTDRTTTDLTEGDNLYYTSARFDSAFSNKTTTDLTEGDNLYYTKVRVDSDVNQGFTDRTTDDLVQGASNLYYDSNRTTINARNSLQAGTGVSYNPSIGEISIGQPVGTTDSVTFDGLRVNGNVSADSAIITEASVNFLNVEEEIVFNTNHNHNPDTVGALCWNSDDETLNLVHPGGVTQQIGQETYGYVRNNSGQTITNGTVVRFSGAEQNGTAKLEVSPMIADGSIPTLYGFGVATQDIANGEDGRVTVWGKVRDVNTSSFNVGDILYVSPDSAGFLTNIRPTAPNNVIPMAAVLSVDSAQGELFIRPSYEQQKNYGTFSSDSNQTLSAIDSAGYITLNTTETAQKINIDPLDPSKVIFQEPGLYTINVNVQVLSTNSSAKTIRFWLQKNGQNVEYSTRVMTLTGNLVYRVFHVTHNISLTSSDYIQLLWASSDTAVRLEAATSTSYSPSAPSIHLHIGQEAL